MSNLSTPIQQFEHILSKGWFFQIVNVKHELIEPYLVTITQGKKRQNFVGSSIPTVIRRSYDYVEQERYYKPYHNTSAEFGA